MNWLGRSIRQTAEWVRALFCFATRAVSRAAVAVLSVPIRLYRRYISPMKPPCCRFTPSCSAYALEALREWGAIRGSLLALRRVIRCNPFGGFGEDPVPVRTRFRARAREKEREYKRIR